MHIPMKHIFVVSRHENFIQHNFAEHNFMHKSNHNMWHEARKQEKKIRCMLVDYQRRAQRRKDYYDKIKADPTQFLQLHGRPCKIHLDPAVCIAANSSVTMMPWQGNTDVMIDRFDVRAHLDMIPEVPPSNKIHDDLSYEERQINYERYRILVQNDFFSIPEGKFLHQINLEEKFGPVLKNVEQEPSKKRATVAIGYNYDDDNTNNSPMVRVEEPKKDSNALNSDEEKDEDSESDIDLDLTVDVSKIETQQANELNTCAHSYGMITNDFFSFLNNDLEEAENMRMVKEQEEEKAMFSGRKSRKERRAFRERTLVGRKLSPPSYAWRKSPSYEDYKALMSSNRSRSKSASPQNSGKITYITSFGGDEPAAVVSNTEKSGNSNCNYDKDTSSRKNRSRSVSRGRDNKIKRIRRSRSSSENRRRSVKSRSRSRSRNRNLKFIRRDDSRSDKPYRRSPSRSRSKSEQRTKTPPRISPKNSPPNNSTPSGSGLVFTANSTDSKSIPRYYGRRKEESSSELSLTSDDDSSKQSQSSKSKVNQASGPSRLNTSIKANNTDKLTPQERLKRKRQVLLNKQFKADKRAEREKVMKMVQERIDRAEEMKEISIKLRRRQRMLRHNDSPRRNSRSSSRSSSSNEWRSSSRSPYRRSHRRNDRYRSPSGDTSGDSGRNDRKKSRRRRSSYSRSRSRSHGRSNSRTPTRRSRYSEERSNDRRHDDKFLKNIKEADKSSRGRRYCTLSEERELARVQLEGKSDSSRRKDRDQRSPKRKSNNDNYPEDNTSDRRDRWGSDRHRDDHSRYSNRRSNSRDRYSRHDY